MSKGRKRERQQPMEKQQFNRELMEFLASSPTPFHAVRQMAEQLSAAGFVYLREDDSWRIDQGGRYFTTRNDSSIIAWTMPAGETLLETGFRMVGAHTDSPCLQEYSSVFR